MDERKIGILILEDEPAGQGVLRQMLDMEQWRVLIVEDSGLLMNELSTGDWNLVIASVKLTGLDTTAFQTLRELALAPVDDGVRLRVLFLVPDGARDAQAALEAARLPYVLRPFHLHDFLDKVSDLLLEIHAIEEPLRQVRYDFQGRERKRRQPKSTRETSMFAARGDYTMTEEEIAEYEKQEQEEIKKRPQKKLHDLGRP